MKPITDRTSYLRGLADGLGIDKEKAENKLMLEMLAVMEDMAQKLKELDDDIDELDEYVASMDDDLADVEDVLFPEDEDADTDEDEDEEVTCPHCGEEFIISVSDINGSGDVLCPSCGKSILDMDEEQE